MSCLGCAAPALPARSRPTPGAREEPKLPGCRAAGQPLPTMLRSQCTGFRGGKSAARRGKVSPLPTPRQAAARIQPPRTPGGEGGADRNPCFKIGIPNHAPVCVTRERIVLRCRKSRTCGGTALVYPLLRDGILTGRSVGNSFPTERRSANAEVRADGSAMNSTAESTAAKGALHNPLHCPLQSSGRLSLQGSLRESAPLYSKQSA
jgi:hypothetical protein